MEEPKPCKLLGIQSLRGVAALMVLVFHLNAKAHYYEGSWLFFPAWSRLGQAGVDVFFVISGFIITYVTPKPLASLRDWGTFLFRRMARIYPAYWAFTLPAIGWRVWKAHQAHLSHTPIDLFQTIFLLPYRIVPPLTVAWTLVYEIHFYLIASLIFFLGRSHRLYAAMAWFLVVAMAPVFQWDQIDNIYAICYLAPYPIEFIAGMIIANTFRSGSVRLEGWRGVWLGAIAFACLAAAFVHGGFEFGGRETRLRVFFYGLPAAILVWAVFQMEMQGSWHWMKRLTFIGDRSYSLYLLHLPVIVTVFSFCGRRFPHAGYAELVVFALIVLMIIAVLVEFSYRCIERPCQALAKRLAPHTEFLLSPKFRHPELVEAPAEGS